MDVCGSSLARFGALKPWKFSSEFRSVTKTRNFHREFPFRFENESPTLEIMHFWSAIFVCKTQVKIKVAILTTPPERKSIYSERSKKTPGTRTGSISGQKGGSRSRGVAKCKNFSTPLEWELVFCEKVAQTRAGEGGPHRILENVTFERRGRRPAPRAMSSFGPPCLARLGQDDGSLGTQTPSNYLSSY